MIRDNSLFAATDKGLVQFNLATDVIERIFKPETGILSLARDEDTLYVGTGKGVYQIDAEGRELDYREFSAAVTDIIPDGNHGFWIGTGSKGLFQINSSFDNNGSLGEPGSVLSLYLDRSDNLWISYLGKGLKKSRYPQTGFFIPWKD